MIGDIIEIERAKRTTFETLETSSPPRRRDPGDGAARAIESNAPHSTFAAMMAAIRDKLGRFNIRLD